jgi:hypothetical protein
VRKVLFSMRLALAVSLIGVMLSGCGASQPGYGPMPQGAFGYSRSFLTQPDAASCPVVGKAYTTGEGHAKVKFGAAKFVAGTHADRVFVAFEFTKWPQQRPLPDWTMQITTCGAESSKKPIGKILNKLSPLWYSCHNGICEYHFDDFVYYEPPVKLPNDKPWKYDEIVVKFKTHLKGFGAMPAARVEIVK